MENQKKEERKRSTYRFTNELEEVIKNEAAKLGISKNAYVQIKLQELVINTKEKIK